jgi:hypothetical protein
VIEVMNFTTKFIQAALAMSFPKIEELKHNRIKELLEIRSKIKEDPELVERWFDDEISKITAATTDSNSSIDLESMINKIK